MTIVKNKDFTGHSESGLEDALAQALQKAGEYQRVEVIETRSSHITEENKSYQVTIAAYKD
ncbi:dodecin domain-containing protein [Legionella erythra]|uniref:Protein with a Dodecin-like topology n=1 Tax=Legionella erythra TaxID=448 RepID=A0A0W0TTC5_LEGER|nr:dodecin domain-containing protein [Legionella erythra]KTC98667.1 hypothetical protein Lery_0831 [Legionella erythra]